MQDLAHPTPEPGSFISCPPPKPVAFCKLFIINSAHKEYTSAGVIQVKYACLTGSREHLPARFESGSATALHADNQSKLDDHAATGAVESKASGHPGPSRC